MLHNRESYFFLPIPLLLALCGMAFCGWNLWEGESALCFSSGCTLFKNFTLGGVSLWWLGLCGFGILALLALAGRPSLGKLGAGIGLLLDCGLLCLLLVSAPCFDCLLVAILLALCYLSFRMATQAQRRKAPRPFSLLLALWCVLFVANLGSLVRDSLEPWPMVQTADNSGYVYISPSCAACRQLVRELPAEQAAKLSWYPVSKNEQDTRILAALTLLLDKGEPLAEAFPKAMESPLDGRWDLFKPDILMLQVRLWRNQAHVLAHGGELPLVEFGGVPAFMLPKQTAARQAQPGAGTAGAVSREPASSVPPAPVAPPARSGSVSPYSEHDNALLPAELEIVGQCGPESAEPCE